MNQYNIFVDFACILQRVVTFRSEFALSSLQSFGLGVWFQVALEHTVEW